MKKKRCFIFIEPVKESHRYRVYANTEEEALKLYNEGNDVEQISSVAYQDRPGVQDLGEVDEELFGE